MYGAAKCDDLCLACLLLIGHSLLDHSCVGLGHVPATVSGFSLFPHLLLKCLFLHPASDPCRALQGEGGRVPKFCSCLPHTRLPHPLALEDNTDFPNRALLSQLPLPRLWIPSLSSPFSGDPHLNPP